MPYFAFDEVEWEVVPAQDCESDQQKRKKIQFLESGQPMKLVNLYSTNSK